MKSEAIPFRRRLWRTFALFAAVVLGLLWLLQTVLLAGCYQGMVERSVRRVAKEMAVQADSDDFPIWLNTAARENSLLIFITDEAGQPLYATDEHSTVYQTQAQEAPATEDNPYRQGQTLGWQKGQARLLSLPSGFDDFLARLSASDAGEIAYASEDGTALIYGFGLSLGGEPCAAYVSTAFEPVGSTVSIIRVQLLFVSLLSLLLAWAAAWALARRFAAPLAALSGQAAGLPEGVFCSEGITGLCAELDSAAAHLTQAAASIANARAYQRDFLANISHDLRTPLTMMKGYAELVRDVSWGDRQAREADLGVIIREADRLAALAGDVTDFTAIESGHLPLSIARFDFSRMALAAARQFASLCEREGYVLLLSIEPELTVDGDEAQLARVLVNLLDNAFTHAGADRTVCLRAFLRGGVLRTEVEDHGEGIPEDVLPHVWERYFRAAQSGRNKKGSGLGLAISRELIKAHQGRWGVHSETGHGSVFWFELDAPRHPQSRSSSS